MTKDNVIEWKYSGCWYLDNGTWGERQCSGTLQATEASPRHHIQYTSTPS